MPSTDTCSHRTETDGTSWTCFAPPHPANPDGHVYRVTRQQRPTAELEAALEGYFRKRVRTAGGYTIKLAPTEAGTPDRLVVSPRGTMHLVELKTTTGVLRAIQVAFHDRMAGLGVQVAVLYGKDDIDRWIQDAFWRQPAPGERPQRRNGPVARPEHFSRVMGRTNQRTFRCTAPGCTYVGNAGNVGRHHKTTGHTGRTEVTGA